MWKEIRWDLEPETPRDDSLWCETVQVRLLSKEVHQRKRYGSTQVGSLRAERFPMRALSVILHASSWIATTR